MKTIVKLAAIACLVSLGACKSKTPQDNAADNITAVTENAADNLETFSDNLSNSQAASTLNNRADAVREIGQNAADAVRNAPPPAGGNNVESNTMGM